MSSQIRKIAVIGLGYIGLPTAALLASRNQKVIGVDINLKVVETINQGKTHIVEPALEEIVQTAIKNGQLTATHEYPVADVFMITVPTPLKEDRLPDISFVETAAKTLAPKLQKGNLVILESTSPVGTTEKLTAWLAEARPDLTFPNQTENCDVHVCYCPERVIPGKTVEELKNNDRVMGGMTKTCAGEAKEVYQLFVKGECILTDARTAELTKLTENAYRDVNIAFANELSLVSDRLGVNVWELIALANRHPRVNILKPGCGVGGHCIAVDPWFIVDSAPDETALIQAARQVNQRKPAFILEKLKKVLAEKPEAKVAFLGLSFKKNIDDLRESPAVSIVKQAAEFVSKVFVVEPHIRQLPKALAENIELIELKEALSQADVLVLLVDHDVFSTINLKQLQNKNVINATSLWQ